MAELRFETERLILRGHRPEDWERVHIYGSIPEFSQFELWGPNTVEDSKRFVSDMILQAQNPDRYKFDLAVILKAKGEAFLIGGCGIRRESQTSAAANMGWAINPEFQGKGYATEAARRLIDFGFHELGLHLIYATCDTRNTASFKVMEKLGMKRVGHLAGDKLQKGFIRDTFRYEILQSEIRL